MGSMSGSEATMRFRVARVLDGDGRSVTPDAVVVVEDGRIVDIRPASTEPADSVVPLGDATLIPGLLDLHVHLNMRGDGRPIEDIQDVSDGVLGLRSYAGAAAYLRSGVTTVLDLGSRNATTLDLGTAIEEGTLVGPTVLSSGSPLTRTGGHMWLMNGEVDGADGIRKAVRERSKAGASAIKLVATGGATRGTSWFQPSFTADELRAAVDEAHALGLPVAAHCTSIAGLEQAVRAGVDLLVHAFFYEPDGTYRFRPDLADAIAASGASVNPTLHTVESRIAEARRISSRRALDTVERRQLEADLRGLDERREMASRLLDHEVPLVVGSDGGFTQVRHGIGTVREMKALAEVGLSPAQVIAAATGNAAAVLRQPTDLGRVRPGAPADFVVLDGDPGRGLEALDDVLVVVKAGRVVHRRDDPAAGVAGVGTGPGA